MSDDPRRAPKLAAIVAGAVLLGGVILQALPSFRAPVRGTPPPALRDEVPAQLAGWVAREVPLGPSEFLATEVEKVLNYDDVLNREYVRGGDRFGVYVAYWGPGRMPTQLVASHTPDRCWSENGWTCLEMRFRQPQVFAGADLPPVEWRVFAPPHGGAATYVVYWHLVDGEVYDYGERFNAIPDPVRWWRGALRQALRGSGEQYFVRLTSDRPLEELWADAGFRAIVGHLAALRPADGAAATPASL